MLSIFGACFLPKHLNDYFPALPLSFLVSLMMSLGQNCWKVVKKLHKWFSFYFFTTIQYHQVARKVRLSILVFLYFDFISLWLCTGLILVFLQIWKLLVVFPLFFKSSLACLLTKFNANSNILNKKNRIDSRRLYSVFYCPFIWVYVEKSFYASWITVVI